MANGTNTTLSGLDLNAPGALDDLFAFHRGLFGSATMEAEGEGTGTGGEGTGEGKEGSGEGTGTEGTGEGKNAEGESLTDDEKTETSYDQKYVSSLRGESAKYRTERNEAKANLTAAETERDQLKTQLAAINKVFNPDAKEGDAPDPDALAKSNTELKRENSILRLAPTLDADYEKLTDSNSFMQSIKDLDPTDQAGLSDKIKAAVQKNPALGTKPQGGSKSGGDLGGGTGENELTLDQFKGMSYEKKVALFKSDPDTYKRFSAQL